MAKTWNTIESKDNVRYVPRNYRQEIATLMAPSPSLWYVNYVWMHSTSSPKYTDKKENKIFPYIRKSRRERLQSHIWLTVSSFMTKYLRISSWMTLQPLPSEFPYILYETKFYFIFYQCRHEYLRWCPWCKWWQPRGCTWRWTPQEDDLLT